MYQPAHFREERLDVQHGLIGTHPLGLLVTHGEGGLLADPLPFLLDPARGPLGTLQAHCARANPHWKRLAGGGEALVVFQGAQAYVTPSWYAAKAEHGKVVPTWNYLIVQARGQPRVIEDSAWLGRQVEALTGSMERQRAEPWAVSDAPAAFVATQLKAIVGIEIEIQLIEGKWKASQKPAGSGSGRRGVRPVGDPGQRCTSHGRDHRPRLPGVSAHRKSGERRRGDAPLQVRSERSPAAGTAKRRRRSDPSRARSA